MPQFQHFILTKFNVRREGFEKDKHGNRVLTDEWMEHRIILFERFCFPSIKNQSNLNFRWLVSFADDTPPKYRRLIDLYCNFSNFTPVFSPTEFRTAIMKHLEEDTEYLITTRLDNDDAFHRDAVSRIQQNFTCQDFEFLNFPVGYHYTYPAREAFLNVSHNNQFTSLVERLTNEPFNTVRRWDHRKLPKIGPIRQLDYSPYWLLVIHDRNKYNVVKGKPCSPSDLTEAFAIQIERSGEGFP